MQETTPGSVSQGTPGTMAHGTTSQGTSSQGSTSQGTGSQGAMGQGAAGHGSISVGTAARQGGEASSDTAQTAEQAINRLADATASSVREVGMKGEQLRQQWVTRQDAMVASARECVRARPLTSVVIAALGGMLFSRLTNGSRRSGLSASDPCL